MILLASHFKIRTQWGNFSVSVCRGDVISIVFPNRAVGAGAQPLDKTDRKSVKQCVKWFSAYFKKKTAVQTRVPVSFKGLSASQKKVLSALRQVPRGEVRSYQWLARESKMGKAYRATGQILGSNPFPVLYPCHRIVRKDGSLSGFSGGIAWKRKLLKFEGVKITRSGKIAGKIIS